MNTRTSMLLLCICCAFVGCDSPTAADPVPFAIGEVDFQPTALSATHLAWWDELSECAGIDPSTGRTPDSIGLRLFEVLSPLTPSGQQFPCYETGRLCSGVWDPPADIYVASGMLESVRTMKHEMLHALLSTYEHTPTFFACTR